eukprot:gene26235-7102_t
MVRLAIALLRLLSCSSSSVGHHATSPGGCAPGNDEACSLNEGGASCSSLQFLPTPATARYGGGNHTAWGNHTAGGGGIIYDGGEYHLYPATSSNACLCAAWKQNSRIEHADVRRAVCVQLRGSEHLQSGGHADWHIDDGAGGPDGGLDCSGSPGPEPPTQVEMEGGKVVGVATRERPKLLFNNTGRFRSFDLWVMSPARFHCATVLAYNTGG